MTIVATSYAILKHQLLDIKTVIQRGLTYALTISVVTICYLAVVAFVLTFASNWTNQAYLIGAIVTTCLGVLGFEPLKQFFVRLTDRAFYRDRLSHDEAIDAFSRAINESHGPSQLVYGIVRTADTVFHAEAVTFTVLNKAVDCTETLRSMTLSACQELTTECPTNLEPPIDLFVPFICENRVTALLGLGNKKSGEPYFADDLIMLTSFAYQAALALDNVQRYQLAKDQVMRLQDQHHHDEQTQAAGLERLKEGMANAARAQEMLATLKQQALATPDAPLSTIADRLAQLEASAHLAGRLGGGIQDLVGAPVFNLSSLVKRLTDHFADLAARQGITVRTDLVPDLLVSGIGQLIEDTLIATIGTSLQYADERHDILVTLQRHDKVASVCVRTCGRFLPASELPPYFDQLRRTTGFGTTLGTGLSMSMSPHEIRLHDDVLEIKTTAEQVTEVCFNFTVVEPV